MSKVRTLKIWVCIALLFAFASGISVAVFVKPIEALPTDVQSAAEFMEDFARDMDLDEQQKRELVIIMDEWTEKRNEIRARYQPEVNVLNENYQMKIEGLLTPTQLERYNSAQDGNVQDGDR